MRERQTAQHTSWDTEGAGPGDVREGYSGSCGQYEPLGERRVQEEQGNGGLRVGPVCVLGGGGGNGVFTSQV